MSKLFSRNQNGREFVVQIKRGQVSNPKNIATVDVQNSNFPCGSHCIRQRRQQQPPNHSFPEQMQPLQVEDGLRVGEELGVEKELRDEDVLRNEDEL